MVEVKITNNINQLESHILTAHLAHKIKRGVKIVATWSQVLNRLSRVTSVTSDSNLTRYEYCTGNLIRSIIRGHIPILSNLRARISYKKRILPSSFPFAFRPKRFSFGDSWFAFFASHPCQHPDNQTIPLLTIQYPTSLKKTAKSFPFTFINPIPNHEPPYRDAAQRHFG